MWRIMNSYFSFNWKSVVGNLVLVSFFKPLIVKSFVIHIFTSLQIDEVISQAQTTRAVLGSQRALFGDVQGKVKNLSDKFPIIRGLLGRKQSMLFIFIFWCDLLFIFYSLFLQVQLEGGDQETPLFSLQSLQLVPCFLLSIGFQNKYTNELLNWYKKVINYDASLGNFDYVIYWDK